MTHEEPEQEPGDNAAKFFFSIFLLLMPGIPALMLASVLTAEPENCIMQWLSHGMGLGLLIFAQFFALAAFAALVWLVWSDG